MKKDAASVMRADLVSARISLQVESLKVEILADELLVRQKNKFQ